MIVFQRTLIGVVKITVPSDEHASFNNLLITAWVSYLLSLWSSYSLV